MHQPAPIDPIFERCVLRPEVLETELRFYEAHAWCLNPYLTLNEAMELLREGSNRLARVPSSEWQVAEIGTNLFLLSCGVLNCVDEYLRGPALRLPSRLATTGIGRGAARFVELVSTARSSRRWLARWREQWLARIIELVSLIIPDQAVELTQLAHAANRVVTLLQTPFPDNLGGKRLGNPTPFSRLDLTHHDVLTLGESLVQRFPDRNRRLLLVGLRTSGSYFAPLLNAFLQRRGYRNVGLMTIGAIKGVGLQEKRQLERFAAQQYLAVIIDDPPTTGNTVVAALGIVTKAGFPRTNFVILAPTHPAKRQWFKWLPAESVITIMPEQWHKIRVLDAKLVRARLSEYFSSRGSACISVDADGAGARAAKVYLQNAGSYERGVRLKRVFEVRLETPDGRTQTKYVLAKSVGWGYFGYSAFLIGCRLAGHVPSVLGLRDGILYMEWIPHRAPGHSGTTRSDLISTSASYAAARARRLKLRASATIPRRYNNGIGLLAKALSRAYGSPVTDLLVQGRLVEKLQQRTCSSPSLIDGNMGLSEWVSSAGGPLKVDFEHHGLGKSAVNLTDPAYDLADTILNLALSAEEERDLITRYASESGDGAVERRLLMQKLLCGLWAMNEVQEQFFSSPRGGDAQRSLHRRFMNAWNFLTVQTARHCGALCAPRTGLRWRAPLVVLDIDGVLDRRLFGFPCTSAAGVEALALLSAHDFSVALNTARSVSEVKDYCNAYSLAGGVAEHGGYLWDAVHQRERVLLSAEAMRQLREMREHLQGIPGMFLDERHQYSIRAFTYREKPLGFIQSVLGSARASPIGDGALSHISTHIVNELLVDLNLDRLTFHHTPIDTAIVAKEVDKGTGLVALRDWILSEDAETIAVGDGDGDLAMFRVATRSFAPANVGCGRQARFLGCQVVSQPYQQGLLEIVRRIVHPEGGHCPRCRKRSPHWPDDPFFSVLQAADGSRILHLLKAILSPASYRLFMRS
jgi:hydroxymethylpyrimidine pyrophosphatase-like HAD family hydrolase